MVSINRSDPQYFDDLFHGISWKIHLQISINMDDSGVPPFEEATYGCIPTLGIPLGYYNLYHWIIVTYSRQYDATWSFGAK